METSSERTELHKSRRLRKRSFGRYRYVRMRWRVLFAVVDFFGEMLFALVRRAPHNENDPSTILLVQLDHLGDAIITTAMLPALRERFPAASIEVLASSANREVFEAAPQVDVVHVSRVNRFVRRRPVCNYRRRTVEDAADHARASVVTILRRSLARLTWIPVTIACGIRLRRRKIDMAIDPRGDFPSAVILWLCGARRRIGFDCGGGGFLLTDHVDYVPDRPEFESRMAVLARVTGWESDVPLLAFKQCFQVEIETSASVHHTIVFHIGAGTRAKRWPVAHWRELLGRIITEHGAKVVLVGGSEDRQLADEILGGRPWPGVADHTGKLRLVELASLLQRASLFVGADSGPAHLAAAVDTPTLVLFSGTNHQRQWQPHGRRVTVIRRPVACSPCHREKCPLAGHPCMTGIDPSRVATRISQILGRATCPTAGLAEECIVPDRSTLCEMPD